MKTMTELFSSEDKWTKRAFARDARGEACGSLDKEAVCWCLFGAIRKLANEDKEEVRKYYNILQDIVYCPVTSYNDNKATFDDIKRIAAEFDKRVTEANPL